MFEAIVSDGMACNAFDVKICVKCVCACKGKPLGDFDAKQYTVSRVPRTQGSNAESQGRSTNQRTSFTVISPLNATVSPSDPRAQGEAMFARSKVKVEITEVITE